MNRASFARLLHVFLAGAAVPSVVLLYQLKRLSARGASRNLRLRLRRWLWGWSRRIRWSWSWIVSCLGRYWCLGYQSVNEIDKSNKCYCAANVIYNIVYPNRKICNVWWYSIYKTETSNNPANYPHYEAAYHCFFSHNFSPKIICIIIYLYLVSTQTAQ